MSSTIRTDLTEKAKYTQDSIQNMLKQNQRFCEGVGELTKIGTNFAISNIPQLKIVNKPIIKDVISNFAESQVTKLCQEIQDGWNSGKYCHASNIPLSLQQKNIAIDLLNGKVDEIYIKQCKPEDLKIAAQSIKDFTQSNEYRSVNRKIESDIKKTINNPDFEIPQEYQKIIEENQNHPTTIPQPQTESSFTSSFTNQLFSSQNLAVIAARVLMGEDLEKDKNTQNTKNNFRMVA